MATGLVVCNEEGNLPMYSEVPGIYGETNIHITLRASNIRVGNWKVIVEGNSDHRLILFRSRRKR